MAKYLKTAFVRDLELQVGREKISYGRMVELLEEEVIKNYKEDNTFMKKLKRFFSDVWLGIKVSSDIKQNHQQFGKLQIMAKRLTLQEKQDCFIKDSINKMFEIAGHSVTFDDIVGRTDEWYTEWTMTVEQNDEWKRWGVTEIQKRFKYKKIAAEKEMGMITLMWGLKFRDFNKNQL